MSDNWSPFALLLIDVQHDFWTDDMSCTRSDYEANVTRLLTICRDHGIDVVHLRAAFRSDQSDWMARYRLTGNIPCVEGTPGAEVLPFAVEADGETVIEKQTFDGFMNPTLDDYLAGQGKRILFVAGLVTSVCVLLTAASAAQRGYLVTVIEDCVADAPTAHAHTLARYPFVFDSANADELTGLRGDLIEKLEIVGG